MSAGMPEIGSKISLISKADIRYEGRLFTVDPQECTIALANVRSFGTEDREAECLVAPQNQVYDYILFRGSDIKDIRVVNNIGPLPNDPAIVQLSVPPSLNQQQYQPSGFTHPVMGHMGHGMPQYPQYGQMGPIGGMPAGMAPGMGMYRDPRTTMSMMPKQPSELVNPVHLAERQHSKDQDFIGGGNGSRTATPPLTVTRKSPTVDQGIQVSPSRDDKKQHQQPIVQQRHVQVGGPVSRGPQQQQQQQQPREQYQREVSREHPREHVQREREAHPREQHQREAVSRDQHQQSREQHQQPREQRPREQREQHPREQREQHPREQREQHPREQREPREQNVHPRDQQGMQLAMQQQQQQRGWVNRGGMQGGVRRGRGRGLPPGMGFNPRGPLQAAGGPNPKPKNTLKFENDYDFEQANTEFEELRTQLAKVKIDGVEIAPLALEGGASTSGAPAAGVQEVKVNGEVEKKEDSGNETGNAEGELEEDHDAFYDKTKSFFDNISCEAVERSKGRSQRTDWRTERKLNSETFGVASARRGGFRGRGGYYNNRGMGGYRGGMGGGMGGGGGGYRGGYRGGQQGMARGAPRGGANGVPPMIQQRAGPQLQEVK